MSKEQRTSIEAEINADSLKLQINQLQYKLNEIFKGGGEKKSKS